MYLLKQNEICQMRHVNLVIQKHFNDQILRTTMHAIFLTINLNKTTTTKELVK